MPKETGKPAAWPTSPVALAAKQKAGLPTEDRPEYCPCLRAQISPPAHGEFTLQSQPKQIFPLFWPADGCMNPNKSGEEPLRLRMAAIAPPTVLHADDQTYSLSIRSWPGNMGTLPNGIRISVTCYATTTYRLSASPRSRWPTEWRARNMGLLEDSQVTSHRIIVRKMA